MYPWQFGTRAECRSIRETADSPDRDVAGGRNQGICPDPAHGKDVVTAVHAGLGGRPDEEVLRLAANQGRVVLTHDIDFVRLVVYERSRERRLFTLCLLPPLR